MAEETAMRGFGNVTVAAVVGRAGVSRRLFYEHFADLEDCLLASFEWALAQAHAAAAEPFLAEDDWRGAVRAGLAALLRFFDAQPALARLCVVHALAGGPRVLARRAEAVAELCALVDRGRSHLRARSHPRASTSPVVAEGVVGAVLAILYARLLDGASPPPRLIELHGELMSVIALPYLGAAAAARELEREPPSPLPPAGPGGGDGAGTGVVGTSAGEGTGSGAGAESGSDQAGSARSGVDEPHTARLTPRTLLVLRAIAEQPGASNREVAQRAGIVDQGQISKLLGRLERQGLVVNRGGGAPGRGKPSPEPGGGASAGGTPNRNTGGASARGGTPNAWWLTERGEQPLKHMAARPQRPSP